MMIFISGGVRSGKSGIAEQCIQALASRQNTVHYIATAKTTDQEMKERIIHHQRRRCQQSIQWTTWEQPLHLHELASQFGPNDILLVDCLTNGLANELFDEEGWEIEAVCLQKAERMLRTVSQLSTVVRALVMVSNELFSGGVPQDAGTYHFMKMLGWLHQRIVHSADYAILVHHGVPILKKGECLPWLLGMDGF
ncbi:Bifunctional adenosylcobalamin biosynthesis protein CobP [Anoxybacillus sp. P3H1B]|uniref:bifunctional adenosylcobinamide kinase/adenosylcobinamide-phosphate guanylyltransferase n=1 Tax=Anoxybacillus sp. P3H1B TaxID=1769293 RepID=UPI000794042A|nr:bifunctional adenosylcobinamide kinase/adenosylcobinamide-phosphate guanylyltransferase [Anoxybacillus sp. P3H1B]KXG11101.1 Bifunctional adenosylcobalamin biosynthesis protein CobP [Anoxybacillus sp. P3H1B]